MDNVERMYRHLVRTIRSKFPQYLTQPFDVATLQQTILPYRHHRRELGLETNEDYELTLTELLAGAHDYLIADDHVRDVLKRNLASTNPDPGAFKQFATATVALSPAALRSLDAGPDDPSTPLKTVAIPTVEPETAARAVAAPVAAPAPVAPPASVAASAPKPPAPAAVSSAPQAPSAPLTTARSSGARAVTPEPGDQCRYCGETLPPGRPITFCPHCGQNVTTIHCLACGSELEVGWKFCPVCGRPASAT